MSGIETIAAISSIVGTGLGVVGSIAQGQAAQQAADVEAQNMEQRAIEERSAAAAAARDRRQRASEIMSAQLARSAASGGGARDPTVLRLMSDVGSEGEKQAQTIRYEGDLTGTGLENQAAMARWSGQQSMLASYINAGSTALSGFDSWLKYRPRSAPAGSYLGTS